MLFRFDEIPSTQDVLKEYYRNRTAVFGDAAIAETQTCGRGRYGHRFHSPRGRGIYVSILLPYRDTDRMTIRAAAVLLTVIGEVTGLSADVKWVNDVFLDGRKIAGILAEAIVDEQGHPGAVVLGVGINLTEPPGGYSGDIQDVAGALFSSARQADLSEQAIAMVKKSLTGALLEKLTEMGSTEESPEEIALYRSRLINPSEVPPGILD
ncbi:MAG: biotin--[acetyl-CoA-carboxylase] ligase [Bacillota bacterium]|jgi:BirA family biotin operon repressor/biotin-[acetyl-CoA-carboxylase] ligase|nr:biotin--[acetyl-CoA-carboxylase] ligase [Eubacteriales bacterium]MDD4286087.1 biotin--[acetyl-CoA-carboxylase] ligase [Eubacteriales bacterium]MDI9491475.1 biotin--[acetyl-CoA-carboxylase] ligase [Bacillota bacterium]NLV70918.1 biotin--[acetyl-CoA-carboxylase] ligase [Clostridiales bacterium]HPF17996.1 biotin--[acetyl-CoA-carboxylase] ligase [Bacillota bacterium]